MDAIGVKILGLEGILESTSDDSRPESERGKTVSQSSGGVVGANMCPFHSIRLPHFGSHPLSSDRDVCQDRIC